MCHHAGPFVLFCFFFSSLLVVVILFFVFVFLVGKMGALTTYVMEAGLISNLSSSSLASSAS